MNKNVISEELVICVQCGKEFHPTKQNLKKARFCSTKCKNIHGVEQWRVRVKVKSIEYLGGKCIRCGYNKYTEVLEFHHRDPSKKDFGISERGVTRSWNDIKSELDKCDLLCANCHREVHVELKRNIPG